MARSCARRGLAADTIFMALVIWRVFFTLLMRRRKSSTFAIVQFQFNSVACEGQGTRKGTRDVGTTDSAELLLMPWFLLVLVPGPWSLVPSPSFPLLRRHSFAQLRLEVFLVFLERVVEALADVVVDLLFLRQVVQQRGLAAVEILVHAVFKGANIRNLDVVEIALRAGEEDHRHLLPGERLELRLLEQFSKTL